jgi:two-component system sensor histidine kinase KdpD
MDFLFSRNLSRTAAVRPARKRILRLRLKRMRRLAAASLYRSWSNVLRKASGVPEMSRRWSWPDCRRALTITVICTVIAWPLPPGFGLVNIVMIYLLGTTLGALRLGRRACVVLAICNMLALDFFFVPPVFSLDVEDIRYFFTLGAMLTIALVIANLMVSIRRHREIADAREQRTAVLYAMSRELAVANDAKAMAAAAVRHICAVFHSTAVVLIADSQGSLTPISADEGSTDSQACSHRFDLSQHCDMDLVREVVSRGERCIKNAIYLPLRGSRRVNGVIVVCPQPPSRVLPMEQINLLDTFAAQLALSLQRARSAEAAEAARLSAERALLRNTLLASISHDLRTPLTAIAGAGSLIAQPEYALNVDRRTTLGRLIEHKARDMTRLLTNVLELVQIEFGGRALRSDWHTVDDLVELALRGCESRLAQRRVVLDLPSDLPLISVEPTLIVQILSNLLENAAKYTPSGTTITICAAAREGSMMISVADDGPGFPPGDPERLFDKFRRGRYESNIVGVGLGLAICRAAANLHGGTICALDNPGGGARFEISLPVTAKAGVEAAAEVC